MSSCSHSQLSGRVHLNLKDHKASYSWGGKCFADRFSCCARNPFKILLGCEDIPSQHNSQPVFSRSKLAFFEKCRKITGS